MNDDVVSTSTEKRCAKCGETKPLRSFKRALTCKDGFTATCKSCLTAKKSTLFLRAQETSVVKHCPKCGETKSSDLFYKTPFTRDGRMQRCIACTRAARKASPPKSARSDATREYARKYRAEHPFAWQKHKEKNREARARRRARQAGVGGRGVTVADMQAMIYCQMGLCAYCERDGQKLTLDHIIPIDQNGPHDPDNCCMACKVCNCSKGARTPEEWEKAGRWFDPKPHRKIPKRV